jgi:hypothetical protein
MSGLDGAQYGHRSKKIDGGTPPVRIGVIHRDDDALDARADRGLPS